MSAGRMIPTEAEDWLAIVQQSIRRASTESAPHFFVGSSESHSGLSTEERLQAAYSVLQAEVAAFGSFPPSPPTIRGFMGRSLLQFMDRLLWWWTALAKRFSIAACEFARIQMEHQEQQRRLLIRIEKRLHSLETMLQQRPSDSTNVEVLVPLLLRGAGAGTESRPILDVSSVPWRGLRVAGLTITERQSGVAYAGAVTYFGRNDFTAAALTETMENAWRALKQDGVLILTAPEFDFVLRARGFRNVRAACGLVIGEKP